MLRKFFPNAPNKTYLQLVNYDPATGEEALQQLATNKLAAQLFEDTTKQTMDAAKNAFTDSAKAPISGALPTDGKRLEYRRVEPAVAALAETLGGASARGERFDGVVAFSQGGNLIVILLALLEAAEAAASQQETAAPCVCSVCECVCGGGGS